MKIWGSGGTAPLILNLDRIWPLCLQAKRPRYPLNRELGGTQDWSRCFGDEKNLLHVPGIEPPFVGRLSRSPLTLYRLLAITGRSVIREIAEGPGDETC
jgi:hypothetical protein